MKSIPDRVITSDCTVALEPVQEGYQIAIRHDGRLIGLVGYDLEMLTTLGYDARYYNGSFDITKD